jgi:hypothetical protein
LSAPQSNGLYIADLSALSSQSSISADIATRIAASAITLNTKNLSNAKEIILYIHEMLNHPSKQIMIEIAKNQSILGLPTQFNVSNINKYFPTACIACALGNLTQKPLDPKLARHIRPTQCGSLVQVDIIGAMDNPAFTTLGINNIRYILTVLDVYSDQTFTFRLKSKGNLIKWIQYITNLFKRFGHPIQSFKFDDEFDTEAITTYLNTSGISYEVCPPHEHAGIGEVERKNRTLQETVIKLLNCSRVTDKSVWPYAFSHAAFTDSLRPKTHLDGKSSFEIYFGRKFDISRTPLLPFMVDVAAHIPVYLQGKLGNKSMICKSLGSSFETNGGTRLLTPHNREIIRRSYKSLYHSDPIDAASLVTSTCDSIEFEDDELIYAIVRDSDAITSGIPPKLPIPRPSGKKNRKSNPTIPSTISSTDPVHQVANIRQRTYKEKKSSKVQKLPATNPSPDVDILIPIALATLIDIATLIDPPISIDPPTPTIPTISPLYRPSTRNTSILKPGSKRVFINDNNTTTIGSSYKYTRRNSRPKKVLVRVTPTDNGTYAKYYPSKQAHLTCTHPNCSIPTIFSSSNQSFISPNHKYCMAAYSNPPTESDDSNDNFPTEIHEIPIPRSLSTIPDNEYYDKWMQAAKDEFSSLRELGTFEEVTLQDIIKSKTVPSKLVFDIRRNPDGSVKKFKARLVARGDLQLWETFSETYADTIDSKSINIIFAIAAQEDLESASIDIKTAFLYSPMNEEVYLRRPKGVSDDMMPEYVRLKKCLYGLKQAAREWKSHLHNTLIELDFTQCPSDHCVYIRKK